MSFWEQVGIYILEHRVEWVFAILFGSLSMFVRSMYKKLKKEIEERKADEDKDCKERELIKNGLLAVLSNDLQKECLKHLDAKQITSLDLNNLDKMFASYKSLGGNSVCERLYYRCGQLKIVKSIHDEDL